MCWVCEGKKTKSVSTDEDWDLYHRILHGRAGGKTWKDAEKEEADACPVLGKKPSSEKGDGDASRARVAASPER